MASTVFPLSATTCSFPLFTMYISLPTSPAKQQQQQVSTVQRAARVSRGKLLNVCKRREAARRNNKSGWDGGPFSVELRLRSRTEE